MDHHPVERVGASRGRELRRTDLLERHSFMRYPIANEVEFGYTALWQVDRLWQNATGEVAYDGSGDPTGTTRLVKQTYATVAVNASGSSVNHSRLIELAYPSFIVMGNVNTGTPVTSTLLGAVT